MLVLRLTLGVNISRGLCRAGPLNVPYPIGDIEELVSVDVLVLSQSLGAHSRSTGLTKDTKACQDILHSSRTP